MISSATWLQNNGIGSNSIHGKHNQRLIFTQIFYQNGRYSYCIINTVERFLSPKSVEVIIIVEDLPYLSHRGVYVVLCRFSAIHFCLQLALRFCPTFVIICSSMDLSLFHVVVFHFGALSIYSFCYLVHVHPM